MLKRTLPDLMNSLSSTAFFPLPLVASATSDLLLDLYARTEYKEWWACMRNCSSLCPALLQLKKRHFLLFLNYSVSINRHFILHAAYNSLKVWKFLRGSPACSCTSLGSEGTPGILGWCRWWWAQWTEGRGSCVASWGRTECSGPPDCKSCPPWSFLWRPSDTRPSSGRTASPGEEESRF